VEVAYAIRSLSDGTVLLAATEAGSVAVPASGGETLRITTPPLAPRLWHPSDPHLYEIEIELRQGGVLRDCHRTTFGFRTFETKGNRFLLNGKPYWLRGANHFPHALGPNDRALAEAFTQLAVDGNVRATRFHVAPLTKPWAEAADRKGLLVSFEGIWPWLMLKGEPPSAGLLQAWEDDFASLVRRYRNHPSVVLWTINNEMKFYIFDAADKEMLRRKWAVVSRMIGRVREIDPTRPVIADSGYVRGSHADDYRDIVAANGFDDGDVDDIHEYYSWYHPSFTTAWRGEFASRSASPDRPFISQELSTGYPRNDDGLPVRFYLFNHQTPQALVGDYAFEHNDPAHFLSRHSLTTRQIGEAIRRTNRDNAAGALHFAYLTWFRDVHDPAKVAPWAPYHALKAALQPVLLSLEYLGNRCYAGKRLRRRLCVVNDSEAATALPPSRLEWRIVDHGKTLAEGRQTLPAIPYYTNHWIDVDIALPATLERPRMAVQLELRLVSEDRVLAENAYDFILASREWALPEAGFPDRPALYDPRGLIARSLPADSCSCLDSLSEAGSNDLLIVDASELDAAQTERLRAFVLEGGLLLLSHAREKAASLLPGAVASYRRVPGEIVNLKIPESPVFEGIEPLDLAWFEDGSKNPQACEGVHELRKGSDDISVLAEFCDFHNYLQTSEEVRRHSGTPLFEARLGRGLVIVSEMNWNAGTEDP
ncbi:MAG TPA: glycoside hydrolase family 2 TIM barrel-domain containing protein, partial [Candidatus Methylacidiphilales bacterium]